MSSATYYDQPNSQPGNAHVSVPSAGPLGGPHGAGIGGVEQQHAYQQSGGYQGQEQGYGYQQQQHPGYNGGEGAGYNAQQQQMGSSNNAPGAIQPPTSTGGGQAAVPDNRDGITKCNANPSLSINIHYLPNLSQILATNVIWAFQSSFLLSACDLRSCKPSRDK